MGILDDAIREHLDLKRRQGAAEDELARLEGEAFGPPSRPGDPDFADRTGQGEQAEDPTGDFPEATATELLDHEIDEPTSAGEAPGETEPVFEDDEAPDLGLSDDEDAGLPGEPTVEHDTLGAGEAQEIELDIDLDIDQEIEEVGGLELDESDEPAIEDGAAPAEAPEAPAETTTDEPIESLDTVEHHFEDAIDEAEVVEDDEPGSNEEDLQLEDDKDEDVLEETPEFLRDQPEDDELWFEQGEPKDFDF